MRGVQRLWGEILRIGFLALETTLNPHLPEEGRCGARGHFSIRMTAGNLGGTLMQVLREIFDENAYARFLQAHGLTHSREAYAHYLEESNLTRERRPRCC